MSSLKRKRSHDAAPTRSPPKAAHRATRHTPNAPPVYKADPEPRRRRARRAGDIAGAPDAQPGAEAEDEAEDHRQQNGELRTTSRRGRSHATAPAPASAHAAAEPTRPGASGRSALRRPVLQAMNQAQPDPALRPARSLRHRHHHEDDDNDQANTSCPVRPVHAGSTEDLRTRGSAAPPRPAQNHPPPPPSPPPPTQQQQQQQQQQRQQQRMPSNASSVAPMTQLPSRSARSSDRVPANTSKPCLQPLTKPAQRTPKPAKKTQQHPSKEHKKPNTAERNIDKVVFGNICFSTWYHSPYGTEALGDVSGNSVKSANSNGPSSQDGNGKDDAPANATSRKTKEDKLDRLYVCPCCFKYSKELVPWWEHVHQCERRGYVPGDKIYTHPKSQRARHPVPADGTAAASKGIGRKRKAPDAAAQPVEDQDPLEGQGEWSIWEVDGEEEGLFCQNLSLFAKLFLDNKSVFFDVVGFKYYLLVHTTPRPPHSPSPQEPTDKGEEDEDAAAQPLPLPLKHQIVGFFSKEKLSWDNNNLACILIFPPWQRKGLGALLMGVSYEISRREGVVGGPEKPISDLGKRGYKRFWAGEIAAWLLGLDTSGDEEVVVDAEECSQATWIVPEDCLAVLREMGVVEEAGLGPPKPARRGTSPGHGDGGEEAPAPASGDKEKEVPRVRISKEAVREWVRANGISLEKACDPDGFAEGYAIKTESVEEEVQ
ncbi:hypothetical protein KVR01_007952 [Diaporthe batatas]|uniref:uncharacterized protein n=1 Tax=Diaporthe batatas TaxID=748121 RepID=UPI001D057D05|nr:uncharacterized protein KVR01_007952 [Diaporthe batatas]KAG8162187.1 hypothetical protein KVR01_007952 [Diaporthe batatas]